MERTVEKDFSGPKALLRTGSLTALAIAVLYPLSRHNYLLFHSIVELASVAVALTLFSIGWNTRSFVRDNTLLVLATGYLPVAILDLLHTLGYKGMGVFPGHDSNLATQLWIAARYLESASLVWAAGMLGSRRPLRHGPLLAGYLTAGVLLVTAIVPMKLFPTCYVEGVGLTPFKVTSEYLICLLLAGAGALFVRNRRHLDHRLFQLLLASVVTTILSELSFTLYVDVYGLANLTGHVFKLLSVVLVYLALVRGSLISPYHSLFRDLAHELAQRKASEDQLRTANLELDGFVHTVSHDLRGALTVIIGYADYLHSTCKEHLGSQEHAMLGQITSSGHSMAAMMEDLLALARVGHLEPPATPVCTDAVAREVLQELAANIAECEVLVELGFLPAIRVPKTLLRQIMSNLLENALHYGASGGRITIDGNRKENLVRLCIRDHGPGIPASERGQLFDLFYRGSAGETIEGTGVGLAIVQKIARLYGGRAWVEDTPGGGATFWVEMMEGNFEPALSDSRG